MERTCLASNNVLKLKFWTPSFRIAATLLEVGLHSESINVAKVHQIIEIPPHRVVKPAQQLRINFSGVFRTPEGSVSKIYLEVFEKKIFHIPASLYRQAKKKLDEAPTLHLYLCLLKHLFNIGAIYGLSEVVK